MMRRKWTKAYGSKFLRGLILAIVLVWPLGLRASPDPKIIEGAKKEGQLIWWNTIAQDQCQILIEEFTKKYPFIKASYWRSGTVGLHNKVVLEARSGRYSWDVLSQTNPEYIVELKQKNLIAPYHSLERSMFSEDLKDKEGYWTSTYALPTGLGYNTKLVKKEDAPRFYNDLLDLKWKEKKISIDNEGSELLVGLIHAWGRDKALQYLTQLAAQEPVPGRGNTQRTQLLVIGEFPLAVAYTHTVEWSKFQGSPVDWVNLEPVVIKVDGIMLGSKALHPNAGKLFIDFMLSQQGQELLQRFRRVTLRTGVEPNPPRLIKGFERVVLTPEHFQNAPDSFKLYREIFRLP
ncbi:MAG: extracellular solute-binding protein [Deltaproteobacteria bacterium]|nr:extracellular solute-binding protein [Deltaproteobacteria bacterium]